MIDAFDIAKGALDLYGNGPIFENDLLMKAGGLAEIYDFGEGSKEIVIGEISYSFTDNQCTKVSIRYYKSEASTPRSDIRIEDFIDFCDKNKIEYKVYFDIKISTCIQIRVNNLFWFEEDDYSKYKTILILKLIEVFLSPPVPESCLS